MPVGYPLTVTDTGGDDLARAEALAQEGDVVGARALAEQLLAADVRDAGIHNLLGFLHHHEGRLPEAQREFERAVAVDPDDADARANLAALRRARAHRPPPKPDFHGRVEDLYCGALGPVFSPPFLGGMLIARLPGDAEARVIEALPGATSDSERRFLWRLAQRLWDGQGDVFENGPLLGGTTRALALGMLANPDRSADAQLHTFDWFFYGSETDVAGIPFDRMLARGLITKSDIRSMRARHTFRPLFDVLHGGHDYSELLHTHTAYLPGAPGDAPATGEPLFEVPEGRRFSLVFIDGCKSWYGTRYCFERLAPLIEPGSHVVFQDYGWISCFWLSTFVDRLSEYFRLVAFVDDTYAFELLKPLDPDVVTERFPPHPADLGRAAFDEQYGRLLTDAGNRRDVHAIVALTIQHAGALAYLGEREEAKARIAALRERPEMNAYRPRMIDPALISPTYAPEGPIML